MTGPSSAQDLFKGRHFDQENIVLCIRWYLTFKLNSRDLVQMIRARHRLVPYEQGHTVDFLLIKRREAAKRFLSRATKQHGAPKVITLDEYAASHRAVTNLKAAGTLPRRVRVRSCKYLNNVVEQDHRRIKQRVRPMLGFKRFDTAAVTIRGIELAEKIKKGQFNLATLAGKPATAPETWAAVLAA